MRELVAPDGVRWRVEVRMPGASNAMLVFHHPSGRTSRLNRYAWYLWSGTEARDVTARVTAKQVLERVDDDELQRLLRRSMPISTPVPHQVPASAGGQG